MSLIVHCQERLDEVRKFAQEHNLTEKLEESLNYLSEYSDGTAECHLFSDFAPNSFSFSMQKNGKVWFCGGLIFYEGAESGASAPQLSVTLSGRKDSRWE